MIYAKRNKLATIIFVLAVIGVFLPISAPAESSSSINEQTLATFSRAAILKEIELYQRVKMRSQDLPVRGANLKYTLDNFEEARQQYKYAIMPERLTRWASNFPLNVRVIGKPPNFSPGYEDVANAVQKAIPLLQEITGLSLQVVEEEYADITISLPTEWRDAFSRNQLWVAQSAPETLPSYFMNEVTVFFKLSQLQPSHTQNYSILTNAIIFAPKHGIHKSICQITRSGTLHIEEAVQGCFLTSLGLTNLFSLEKWDFEENLTLLSILYNPKLQAGMTMDEARPILEKLLQAQ